MRLSTRTSLCLAWVILVVAVFGWALAVCLADKPEGKKPASEEPSGNTQCLVCHLDLQTEEIAVDHLDTGITCKNCHGPCVEHMHDEMLMTKPDQLFGRAEVERMCSMCHKPGEGRQVYSVKDHNDLAAVEAFRKKWLGRVRPNGRAITAKSICTDCHGTHNIIKQMGSGSEQEQPGEWVSAFNGRDLSGWQPLGSASWTVKGSQIVGTCGPNGNGGDLWTEAVYEDYLLSVTFRATWPIQAGIWLRSAGTKLGPRVEIFDSHRPPAFTGSVWMPGKGPVLVNLRDELVDRASWNTISVEVRGDRVAIWLNGEEIGSVRTDGPAKGKIGLHIERAPASKGAELHIREVLVQRLASLERL